MVEIAYALDETWTLPSYGIYFNSGTPDETGCVYWVTEDMGWRGGAAPRPMRDNKATASGQFRRPNYRSGLVVTWNGHLFGPDARSRALGERKLARIGSDPQTLFEVQCQDSAGAMFSMMELDGATRIEPLTLTDSAFSMQFAAPDPRRYVVGGTTGGTTDLPSSSGGLDWVTGGGLNWITSGGLNWGTTTSVGQITFNNTGTAASDPVFTITVPSGTLLNPTITFTATGQRLKYTGTLTAPDTLRIDTSPFTRSVLLNGTQDVRVRLTTAEWFQIPPGLSTVNFSADNVNAAALLNGSVYIANW